MVIHVNANDDSDKIVKDQTIWKQVLNINEANSKVLETFFSVTNDSDEILEASQN